MKTKFLLIITLILTTFSLKSQMMQTLNDTDIIFYDYYPDVLLYGSTQTNQHDSLRIDINQDGTPDFKFYYVPCYIFQQSQYILFLLFFFLSLLFSLVF